MPCGILRENHSQLEFLICNSSIHPLPGYRAIREHTIRKVFRNGFDLPKHIRKLPEHVSGKILEGRFGKAVETDSKYRSKKPAQMDILSNAEKQRQPDQLGDWLKKMARRRYQKGTLRIRGKVNQVWELLWREDYIKHNGTIGRRLVSKVIGPVRMFTRRQAQKLADEFLRPLNQGKVTPHSTILFREFIEKYFVPNAFPTLKQPTQSRYHRTLKNHLLPAFGEYRLCEIGTLDIQSFVLKKMGSGLGWASADLFRNLMSKIFGTAKKWGYFAGENPASGVELPEYRPVREKHILTPDQVSALLDEMREPFHTMVLLALLTGLRVAEILGLRWEDVDFSSSVLRVSQRCYRGQMDTPKTKSSKRSLPLPSPCLEALKRHQAKRNPNGNVSGSGLVFETSKGTPYGDTNLLHRELKPAGRKIGAPWLNWHTFRRTHATLLQFVGGSLKDAQAQLGHSKLSTTLDFYTFAIPAHQREAVQKLGELLTNVDEIRQSDRELPIPATQIQ
jgi:integrase